MNQSQIQDLLSPCKVEASFVSRTKEDPNAGWYAHGTGAETRIESENRAAVFYIWLCEYLDSQLMGNGEDIFDAGVSLPTELEEIECDKLSARKRKRRNVLLVGHGDFMSLLLKRIVAGFCNAVEYEGIPHRTALIHFNTGITELEYFGSGRFLVMNVNLTPHLKHPDDIKLKTSGGLKDGWSYIIPKDACLRQEKVEKIFSNKLKGALKEQTDALKSLYLPRLNRTNHSLKDAHERHSSDEESHEITFLVKRGLQVVACIGYNDETGFIYDLVVRPSVKNGNSGKILIDAVLTHAEMSGREKILAQVDTDECKISFEQLGFHPLDPLDVSKDKEAKMTGMMYKSRL